MAEPAESTIATRRSRIEAIDLARAVALAAMAVYHFTWDLESFGYLDPGTAATGGWKLFARCIASSFLFLAGLSLVLAHGRGIRWRSFWRRWAGIVAAAAVISAATWYATPDAFIFFGILHQIALGSLLGLAFLRLPASLTIAAAVLVVAAPHYLRSPFFDHPVWWWTGLSSDRPRSNDYVPIFPWFGAVLAGIAAGRLWQRWGVLESLSLIRFGRWSRVPRFLGRHSLAVYLVHQPVLIALLWLYAQVAPPQAQSPEVRFIGACEATCRQNRDEAFCERYCGCMLDTLGEYGMLDGVLAGDASLNEDVEAVAGECTVFTETRILEEEAAP